MSILQDGIKGFGIAVSPYEMDLVDGLPFDLCARVRSRESVTRIEQEEKKKERYARLDYYRELAEKKEPLVWKKEDDITKAWEG